MEAGIKYLVNNPENDIYKLVEQIQENKYDRNKPYPQPELLVGLADDIAQNPVINVVKLRTKIFHSSPFGLQKNVF